MCLKDNKDNYINISIESYISLLDNEIIYEKLTDDEKIVKIYDYKNIAIQLYNKNKNLENKIKELNKDINLLKNKNQDLHKKVDVKENNKVDKKINVKIIVYDNNNTDTKKKGSKETITMIKHYKDLFEIFKVDNKSEYDALDDCAGYLLKKNGKIPNRSNREKWRNKIRKCNELYNEIGEDDLSIVKFPLGSITNITGDNWIKWKKHLKTLIQNHNNK